MPSRRARGQASGRQAERRSSDAQRTQQRAAQLLGFARVWHDYALSIVLFTLFALAFVGHTATGWMQYASEQQSHGETPTIFGDSGYIWYWAEWTLQNWQSEFLELGVIVVLSSFLIHKGSAESKDSDDEIKDLLTRIEQQLDELEPGASAAKRKPSSSRKQG
jgi:hypothetical protein